MFKTSFQIAKVFGIPIRLDLSLLILMGLIWFQTLKAGLGFVEAFLFGGAEALLLLLSIVLHELGHSLVSMQFGCRVRAITLMLIGGRAELSHLPTRPWQEFAVAIAGPSVSLALWLGGRYSAAYLYHHAELGAGMLCDLLAMLGMMNFYLFWFNLVPAFPMDGGRVLRAVLAHGMGRLRATRVAANLGRTLAILAFIAVLLPGPVRLHMETHTWQIGTHAFTVGPFDMRFDKFMLGLIALFIFQAAGQESKIVEMEDHYRRNGQRPPWMPPPPPQDQVVVSPPPYERDRSSHGDFERDHRLR